MPSNFLITFFLFLILLVLIIAALFYFSAGKKVVIENTESVELSNNNQSNESQEEAENQSEPDGEPDEIIAENNNEDINISAEAKNPESDVKPDIKSNSAKLNITDKKVSWGYKSASKRNIDTIIIHSSYDALGNDPYDLDGLLKEYKIYGVAPHFVIDRKGRIYRLIADKNIAYHAGVSQMPDGRNDVNNFSIGIELMNTKEDEYTEDQYEALSELIDYLKNEHTIKHVLGHSQIAPERKTDPWNFDYSRIE